MMTAVLDQTRVPRAGAGRPRTRPQRALTGKGYPSRANRAWLRARGIKATIPERNDQIAHRRKRPGLPIDFGPDQRERYRARSDVERCFSRLKQWRGIAMRTGETARSHNTAITLPRS
jgi:transposase